MLYNELIAEIVKRVERFNFTRKDNTTPSFKEKLYIFLQAIEEDIVMSYAELTPPATMTEEKLADAEFEKKLDEELHS